MAVMPRFIMIKFTWFISFYILGALYLIDWYSAQSKCKKNDKWLLFTPFWFFFPDKFGDSGKDLCKRVKIYFVIAIVLFLVWKLGYVDW